MFGGSNEGLLTDNITFVLSEGNFEKSKGTTTPGRRTSYRSWRTNIISINQEKLLFLVKGDYILFTNVIRIEH